MSDHQVQIQTEIEKLQKGSKIIDLESLEETLNRIIEIQPEGDNIRIITASDDLNLDHKIQLERILIRTGFKIWDKDVHVYFKRTQTVQTDSNIKQPRKPLSTQSIFGSNQKKAIPGVTHVIAVASGKGGVGKSTVSSNLAVALALEGKKVGLLDADIYGPSSPTMLGIKGQMQISDRKKMIPLESHGVKCVSFGFLSDTQSPVMWRGPMVAKAVRQICYDVEWGELDYLVIDLPPGTGDVQLALIENTPITSAIIVSTPQDIALIDAHKGLTMFEKTHTPVLGLVENMSVYQCPNCGHEEHIFGSEAIEAFKESRGLKVLANIPLHLSVRTGGDTGKPVVLEENNRQGDGFRQLARKVLEAI